MHMGTRVEEHTEVTFWGEKGILILLILEIPRHRKK